MRRTARALLILYVFTIPWEYSLDLGEPIGNIARLCGLVLIGAFVLTVLKSGRVRSLSVVQWLVVALYLWMCASYTWSMDRSETVIRIRALAQVMMPVFIVWELVKDQDDLLRLMRSYVAGSWVLVILTIANFLSPETADQVRFAPVGQDPNDVARFLDVGLPFAALLVDVERSRKWKILGWGYLALGTLGVLVTASRGGFIAAAVAIVGCALLLWRNHARIVFGAILAFPVAFGVIEMTIPEAVWHRLGTIPEQLLRGDLNQRLSIWTAGWDAFGKAPFMGFGAGTFVGATGLSHFDTAHNSALALGVEGGVIAVALALAIAVAALHSFVRIRGSVRISLGTALIVWFVTSLVSTVEINRTTWLLVAIITVTSRLSDGGSLAMNGMPYAGRVRAHTLALHAFKGIKWRKAL